METQPHGLRIITKQSVALNEEPSLAVLPLRYELVTFDHREEQLWQCCGQRTVHALAKAAVDQFERLSGHLDEQVPDGRQERIADDTEEEGRKGTRIEKSFRHHGSRGWHGGRGTERNEDRKVI